MKGLSGNRFTAWMAAWRGATAARGSRVDPLATSEAPDAVFEDTWRRGVKQRVVIVVLALACWSAAIEARLVVLQVVQHTKWLDKANSQRQKGKAIPAKRGDILDRNGEILAWSIDMDMIFAMPNEIKNSAATVTALCDALGGCTEADQPWIDRINQRAPYAEVRRGATSDELAAVRKLRIDGVGWRSESRRFYPNVDLAAHVLGFVGGENKGLRGIEERYDSRIRGQDGHMQMDVDHNNHAVEIRVDQAPTAGETLELTINASIQHFAERELKAGVEAHRALAGSAVVMDPNTGEILALANYPTFNPNAYQLALPEDWKNRAVENNYEPGSTFKIVTASAAIEEGVEKLTDIVDCEPGVIVFPGRKPIREAMGHDYGVISFEDVIVHSSNIGAIRVGLKVGAERMLRYVRRFGFGEALAPDFAGQNRGQVGLPPNDSALASMAMGYQVSVTPLQMATAVSAVANGGALLEPHLVRAFVKDGVRRPVETRVLRQAINPETAASMTEIMEAVAERGTGRKAQLTNYQVAGKTGTAAKLVGRMYSTTDYNTSFVGFVPSRKPSLVIVVVVDTPKVGPKYGGDVAAPIFQAIADAALRQMAVPATINPVPPVLVSAANAASAVPAGGPLVLPTVTQLGGQALVPDVRGMSARDALRIMSAAGLTMRMSGSGLVVDQTPAPGTPLERGGFGTLRFSRAAPDTRAAGGGR